MSKSCRDMIEQVRRLHETASPLLTMVKDVHLLLSALQDLDNLVEMASVKDSIVIQLRFLLLKQYSAFRANVTPLGTLGCTNMDKSALLEGHMLHTVIYGPPGTGKTKVGTILAKIWLSLGLLNTKVNTSADTSPSSSRGDKPKLSMMPLLPLLMLNESIKNSNETKSSLRRKSDRLRDRYGRLHNELDRLKDHHAFLSQQHEELIYRLLDDMKGELDGLQSKLSADDSDEDTSPRGPNVFSAGFGSTLSGGGTLIIGTNGSDSDSPERSNPPERSNTPERSNASATTYSVPIKVVSRADFVAEYLGQTAIKTKKLLTDNLGKVVFIDEAYSLINGDRDSYGMEALTVINQFMSEHANDIIIIFAGYRDMMDEMLFKKQPGLKRRCTWIFEVDGYTAKGLADIFRGQLAEHGWHVDESVDLVKFFEYHRDKFPAFGGDTSKFAFYCKLAHSSGVFDHILPTLTSLSVLPSSRGGADVPPTPLTKVGTKVVRRKKARLTKAPPKKTITPTATTNTTTTTDSHSLAPLSPIEALVAVSHGAIASTTAAISTTPSTSTAPSTSTTPTTSTTSSDHNMVIDQVITSYILETALTKYCSNRVKDDSSQPPFGVYM